VSRTLFHLVGRDEWAQTSATQTYRPPSLTTEGFIHLSTASQLLGTARRFFAGRDDLLAVSIDEDRLGAAVRWESADGELFPHLYAPLDLSTVVEVIPLPRTNDGFEIPERWGAKRGA
jgi:uncharacterized protein (DUF952 family)